jgi:hypothetical protein
LHTTWQFGPLVGVDDPEQGVAAVDDVNIFLAIVAAFQALAMNAPSQLTPLSHGMESNQSGTWHVYT